jgi:hypothetical protein
MNTVYYYTEKKKNEKKNVKLIIAFLARQDLHCL